MATRTTPRFIFRGNAMPFGGRITKKNDAPFLATLNSPPVAALTVAGGLSRASGGASSQQNAFRWKETIAEARGELLTTGDYQTTVTSAISGAWARNDPHVFQAGSLRVSMVSLHTRRKPASIQITEVVFSGLKLGGDDIAVEVSKDLNDAPTMDAFNDKYQSNREFFARHQNPLMPGKAAFGDPIPRNSGGYAITSIVTQVRWRERTFRGNMIRLPDFGKVYFGEVLMNENNRRLTMVRLEMGSALGAEIALAEADPNGTWGI